MYLEHILCFFIGAIFIILRANSQIIGGVITDIEEIPFQVAVIYDDKPICGGVILDRYTILTACHCVYDENHKKFSVKVGHSHYSKGAEYHVKSVIEHDYYNIVNNDYDLAILKLFKPLQFSKRVKPIQLIEQNKRVEAGTIATVSGWGETEDEETVFKDELRRVAVRVINNTYCKDLYGLDADITKNMLCASYPKMDACYGDSGGPLTFDDKLIGVVSWGIGCGEEKYPGVYVNVSRMHSWITDHIEIDQETNKNEL